MPNYEAALRRIEERWINTCNGCGDPLAEWTPPTLVAFPEINGGVIADRGVEAYAVACQACGYMRFCAVETGQP